MVARHLLLAMLVAILLCTLVTASLVVGEECFEKGRCSEIPLEYFDNVPTAKGCWELCRKNRQCSYFTSWEGRDDCFLYRECGQLLVECDDCQSGRVTCVPSEGFELLVFGGYNDGQRVRLYQSLFEDSGCQLKSLPRVANFKPVGGFMDNNITICAGGLVNCYYLNDQQEEMEWVSSFGIDSESPSLTTTYDDNVWTVFPGAGTDNELRIWSSGTSGFQTYELGFEYSLGSCSVRRNQTHAIVSKGSRSVFWYQEDGNLIERWVDGPNNALVTGCGLTFGLETGYQLVIAGGFASSESKQLDRTEVFNFDDNLWTVGQNLPRITTQAASIDFQNTFILVGGRYFTRDDTHYDTLLMYDTENGWIELPLILEVPDFNMGVMMVPTGRLQCP